MTKRKLGLVLDEARTIIQVLDSRPDLREALSAISYAPAQPASLAALYHSACAAQVQRRNAASDLRKAAAETAALRQQVDVQLRNLRAVLRLIYQQNRKMRAIFGLRPRRKATVNAAGVRVLRAPRHRSCQSLITRGQRIYLEAQEAQAADDLGQVGYPPQQIQQESATLDALERAWARQASMKGAAQNATAQQAEVFGALERSLAHFRALVRILLRDSPADLVALGVARPR